jgi:translocation and assembly module TamA
MNFCSRPSVGFFARVVRWHRSLSWLMVVVVSLRMLSATADVVIEGVSSEVRANVLAHMRLDDESCDAASERVRFRFNRAEAQIHEALEPYGFYGAEVHGAIEFPDQGCWSATFEITTGAPVVITELELKVIGDGDQEPVFQTLLDRSALKLQAPLLHGDYETLKSELSFTARELGYFDARFVRRELRVQPDRLSAGVFLVMDTGARYRFGELTIESEVLDPQLVRRYVQFTSGNPYEQKAIRQLRSDLARGEYFSEIDVTTQRNEDLSVDVNVKLSTVRRVRYGVGLGYGTDTGPVVSSDMVVRWLNRRGHRLELDAEASEVMQSFSADYRIPGKRPQRDWYSIYGGLSWRDSDAIESKTRKIGGRETRFHNSRWRSNRFVEYVQEDYRVDGVWEQTYTLVPGYTLTYLAANAADRPTLGVRLGAEVLGASEAVLSDSTFVRLRAFGKTILPISPRARLLLRGEAGVTATEDFSAVPPTWRFYAGGDNSVRGYAYQSLGEKDDSGRALGGERLLTGSAEVDWRLTDHWSVALFADAGDVGEDKLLEDLPWAVGGGIRWYSPLGPIRVDVAFPQEQKSGFRLHVSMGPDL